MTKTRILFVMLQLDAGGSERVVYELARQLDRETFEVYIAAFKGGALTEPLRQLCREVVFIDKRAGLDPGAMFKLARLIRKYRIEVVNAHHYMPCFYSFFAAKMLARARLVYTEHSIPEVEVTTRGLHGRIFARLLSRIDAVVGVSREICETFRTRHPRHAVKFHEILNGVDLNAYASNGTRTEIRNRWNLRDEHFVVGTVANFRRVKNHACLVRAAGRLKDSHPQLRLLLVGSGFPGDAENSEAEVRSLIGSLGLEERVILAGYQSQVGEMLSAFDAFCLPSFSEGLPVSLLEAMAADVPVVGSAVRGISEVISHGQTGLLFANDDDADLARVLKEVIDDQHGRVRRVRQAAEFVRSRHDNRQFVKAYARLFASLAGRTMRPAGRESATDRKENHGLGILPATGSRQLPSSGGD